MPVSTDVMELVELLNEEGFGFLAGELLTEISLGREIEDDGDLGTAIAVSDPDGGYDDAEPAREPIPEAEQLGEALAFLEARLVEPIRHLADAEAIAGCLAAPRDPDGQPDFQIMQQAETPARGMPGAPLSIAFQPPPDRKDERLYRAEAPGTARAADLLSRVLQELVREAI